MLSRVLWQLYRWSLRRSGPLGPTTEYVYRTKAIRPEYIGSTLKIQGVRPEVATEGWGKGGLKNTPHRRPPGRFRGR